MKVSGGSKQAGFPRAHGESRFGLIKEEPCETPPSDELPGKVVSTPSLGVFNERLLSFLLRDLHGQGGGLVTFEALEPPKHGPRTVHL